MAKKQFVDKGNFLKLLIKYHETGVMCNDLGTIFTEMADRLTYARNFINYSEHWKNEMKSDALFNCCRYAKNFNIAIIKSLMNGDIKEKEFNYTREKIRYKVKYIYDSKLKITIKREGTKLVEFIINIGKNNDVYNYSITEAYSDDELLPKEILFFNNKIKNNENEDKSYLELFSILNINNEPFGYFTTVMINAFIARINKEKLANVRLDHIKDKIFTDFLIKYNIYSTDSSTNPSDDNGD